MLDKLKTIKHIDKWMHIWAGFFIALVLLLVTGSPIIGVWGAWIVGTWKEFEDKKDPANHSFDGWDAQATTLGGLVAATLKVLFF
jgi:hypothetical protein